MTELIWEGKYVDGKRQSPVRVALPFQTIETVNESAADRKRTLELFSSGRETEWRNRLIWGDKKYVLPSLLPEFAGKVSLIYIDPPFDTGADFSFRATIPSRTDGEEGSFVKEPSIIEQKAYRDTWGRGLDSYLEWFHETALFLYDLLAVNGSVYVHLDWHVGHYAKAVLDEVFARDNFRSEIVWQKIRSSKAQSQRFGNVHDALLFYSKGSDLTFNPERVRHSDAYLESHYRYIDSDGRRYASGQLHTGWSGAGETIREEGAKPTSRKTLDLVTRKSRRWYGKGVDCVFEGRNAKCQEISR
jgi:adenine specific DNA methylase Mod